jgi:hypothetical protein
MKHVIFVYALDGGLFNDLTNFAHKLISPQTYPCNLCTLTSGMVSKKREWTEFLRGLGVETELLHRNEFAQRYPTVQHSLPAAFLLAGDAQPELLITSDELNACRNLDELISLVSEKVKQPTAL